MIKRILIDPGHGGKDPGAVNNGINEKDLNLSVSTKLMSRLIAMCYEVRSTRLADIAVSLESRADMQKAHMSELFISIHHDSYMTPEPNGFTVFYNPGSIEGKRLAGHVENKLKELGQIKSRGIKSENFAVLRLTTCPAILIECGFMSNINDFDLIRDTSFQSVMATSISLGINNYCVIKDVEQWP